MIFSPDAISLLLFSNSIQGIGTLCKDNTGKAKSVPPDGSRCVDMRKSLLHKGLRLMLSLLENALFSEQSKNTAKMA
jgi:hypothetical protein